MSEESATEPLIVLVVEDEHFIRELVVHSLEEGGFSVEVAGNGDEAIAIMEKNGGPEYRALLTDIDLGSKTTGWEVAHRARELNPDLPVVYMTGAKAGDWSANGVPNSVLVTKPFAPAQILTAISQLLNAGNTPGA